MNKLLTALVFCLFTVPVSAQTDSTKTVAGTLVAASGSLKLQPFGDDDAGEIVQPVLKLNLPVDAAITIPATAWTVYAFPLIYGKDEIDSLTVATLDKNKVPSFDRWAIRSSDKAAAASDLLFYGSMPYPFLLLADRAIRKDALKVGALYWEAMSITGLLYTGGDYFVDRYRPETYDVDKKFSERKSGNEKNAFFAGHVALVSTSTFFTASIYDMYHPTSKFKWALYGVAIAATGTTAYLRYRAGKHFPSDILIGTIVGVSTGMLVPRLHRYKPNKRQAWRIMPAAGDGYGLAATYSF